MRASFVSAGVAIIHLANAERVKFGVLSDIHLQALYQPDRPADKNCIPPLTGHEDDHEKTDDLAYFGRLGCDLPAVMVEHGFRKMAADNPDINFMLVPGDFAGHYISLDQRHPQPKAKSEELYEMLKGVHQQVVGLFEKYFHGVPVLMNLGNNDTKYHYQPPFGDDKKSYLEFLDKTWFTDYSGN